MSITRSHLTPLKSHKGIMAVMTSLSLVLASASALAAGSVKIECWGDCGRVSLGQICDTYRPGSTPIAVACDDTATPGSGAATGCGSGATCTQFGALIRGDLLSAYCADGGGNDAVITCSP